MIQVDLLGLCHVLLLGQQLDGLGRDPGGLVEFAQPQVDLSQIGQVLDGLGLEPQPRTNLVGLLEIVLCLVELASAQGHQPQPVQAVADASLVVDLSPQVVLGRFAIIALNKVDHTQVHQTPGFAFGVLYLLPRGRLFPTFRASVARGLRNNW